MLRPASRGGPLAGAFGFTSPDPLPETGYGHPWIEFRLGNSSLMILKLTGEPPTGGRVHVPWVYVDDITGH